MSYIDLHTTLREWPYDPDQISVRKILGTDGVVRIQMRVELGILQMDAEGRPDGAHPHNCESLLEYHRKRLLVHEERNGTTLGYVLNADQCQELRTEASLYYRRFVALFVLEEYAEVVRDTAHNLGIFDLCRDFAHDSDDRACLETFRPYVLMMDARARAYHALQEQQPASALAHVNRGIMHLRTHFDGRGEGDVESCEEMKMLRALSRELASQMPEDSLVVTRRALRTAIENERFEEAARLRDALKNLHEQEHDSGDAG